MSRERHDLTGRVEITLRNKQGKVIEQRVVQNEIMNTGRELVAKLFAGQERDRTVRVAVGISEKEVSREQKIGAREYVEVTGIDDLKVDESAKVSFSSTFGEKEKKANDKELREAGIVFSVVDADNPLESGILYNVVTFSAIHKKEGDVLTLNWEITF